jgi:hypothetical protein
LQAFALPILTPSSSTHDHNQVIALPSTVADVALRLSCHRFHEQNFMSNWELQKALENSAFSRA